MNDVGDVDRMSVGRYASVLHSALRLWKVFYVLSSKIRTPGQGRGLERASIVRSWVEAGTTSPRTRELDVLSYFHSDGVRIPTKSSLGKSEARCTTVSKSKGNKL